MARLKQLEPKKETIGGLNFYIRPFPAMVAANLTGDLASLLTPVLYIVWTWIFRMERLRK